MSIPIVAFAEDWHEEPSPHHRVLRELARSRRVLWLNALATRAPGRGLRRGLRDLVAGPRNVEHDLWVATPPVLPLPHGALDRKLLRAAIRALRARLGIARFQLWTFLPNTADYVGTLGEELAVYYCGDEWSLRAHLDRDATRAAERRLLARVDATFAATRALADAKRGACRATFVAPHGVDHALFARALEPATRVAADLAALPGPRIGVLGAAHDELDVDLVAALARARPAWTFALIGPRPDELPALRDAPNVHALGPRRAEELPAYCKGLDVGLVPARLDERAAFAAPPYLREYLAAGLPVVATALPELARGGLACHVGRTPAELLAALDRALTEGGAVARRARSAAVAAETWAARVAEVARALDSLDRRTPSPQPRGPRA